MYGLTMFLIVMKGQKLKKFVYRLYSENGVRLHPVMWPQKSPLYQPQVTGECGALVG
jgi:hypothetical protein